MAIVIHLILIIVMALMVLRYYVGNVAEVTPFWVSVHAVVSANSVSWGIVATLLVTLALVLRMNSRG